MIATSMNQIEYKDAYGILCGQLPNVHHKGALNPTFCRIPSLGQTTLHAHFEPEIFFIIRGSGEIDTDGKVKPIHESDLIQIPAYVRHSIRNTQIDPLEFLSIYSQDSDIPALPNTTIITAAPPTPNGPLHLGHISGPYLASDIVARYLKSKQVTVSSHSFTDDHQNYVNEKAQSLQTDYDEFQTTQRSRIQKAFRNLNIKFDDFFEPRTDKKYQTKVVEFAARALNAGIIQKELLPLPYCSHCDIFLIDALINAKCPECHSSSRGACESCGIVVSPAALLEPSCARCNKSSEFQEVEVHTFSLSRFLPLITDDLKNQFLPIRLRKLVERVQSKSNLKLLVSHPHNHQAGILAPDLDNNLHVWFEMAAQYEAYSKSSSTWIHFFGFDNSFHYLLFIPALLKAMDTNARLPSAVVTNEFLTLDGLKFSTSRNHAIWADDFKGDSDFLRLYLCTLRPQTSESDFKLDSFAQFSYQLQMQIQKIIVRAQELETNPDSKPAMSAEQKACRFSRDIDAYFALPNINIRAASRHLVSYLDEVIDQFGDDCDDVYRLEALMPTLSIFMPIKAHEINLALHNLTEHA